MKKILYLLITLMVMVGLAACADDENEESKDVRAVESSDEDNEQAEDEAEEEEEESADEETFDKEIADNDHFKATLTNVKHIEDKEWDEERIEATFEVENKRDEAVEVQAREVSADGKMVDESMVNMSQEVAAGKKADAVLQIENFDGDLPDMEEELEMKLHVFSWDDMDFEEDYDVKVAFD